MNERFALIKSNYLYVYLIAYFLIQFKAAPLLSDIKISTKEIPSQKKNIYIRKLKHRHSRGCYYILISSP